MQSLYHHFGRSVDNSPLVLFRICFGMLMFFEGIGAILTGWIHETFIEPSFTFNFIGFDFLQVLAGPQMYVIYSLLSLLGIAIALGWRFRMATILFSILWAATYFLQKTHYNNHYYLVWIISMFLMISPADQWRSLDVAQGRTKASNSCPAWSIRIFQVQIAIVYFYAAIAKIYPDWLHARPIGLWFTYKNYAAALWNDAFAESLKTFFSKEGVHYFFSYAGIFFDLFVVPAFLWKRTRTIALIASLIFHLTNSMLFQIGVFPYFTLSFVVFFYKRNAVRKVFFPKKPEYSEPDTSILPPPRKALILTLILFFLFQLSLPLRHWRIPGDVLWTEEGHRLSWRMMLRSKRAHVMFTVKNEESGIDEHVKLLDHLSRDQARVVGWKPDMIWQFSQYLDQYYREQYDTDVAVYVYSRVGVNGRALMPFTDRDTDISAVRWNRFGHQEWILPKPFQQHRFD